MATQETGLTRANGGATVQREEFGATELQTIQETASTAVAAREKAAVEARYIVAMRRPRSLEKVRQDLLKACSNHDFAESSWFVIPNRGEGFTIRFAEEALRCMGNVYPETMTVYENAQLRMIRSTVTDLESNTTYSSEIIVQKTIERKNLKKGQQALGERINSYGDKVYIVEATDDEVTVKQNSAKSKAIRTDGLRLIPSWIKEEAKRAIFATMEGKAKADPDAEKRKLIDSFAEYGVKVPDLEQYLGHTIEKIVPKEIVDLRKVYVAVVNGDVSWVELMEECPPSEEEQHGSVEAAQKVAEEKLAKIREETGQAKATAEVKAEESKPATAPKQSGFGSFGGKK